MIGGRSNNIKDFDLHLLGRTSDKRSTLSIEKDIHRATKILPPHMKQHILDCIRNRNSPTIVSEKQGNWLKKHHEYSLFGSKGGHRYLLSESPHNHGVALATSPSPTLELLSDHLPPLPPNLFVAFSPPPPPPPPPPHAFDPSHNEKQRKSLIIASAASGIIILIGLLLCCWEVRKSKKVVKDDRPLLILSSTDLSGGMS